MQVTATGFILNFEKYPDMLPAEDIWITRNGKTVAKMIDPNVSSVDRISGILAGRISPDIDRHSLGEERCEASHH